MAITLTDDAASIGSTEYFLFSDSTTATYKTTDQFVLVALDLSNLAAGDQYRLRVYEKINGSSALVFFEAVVTGAQASAFLFPPLPLGNGYEASVKKLAGTDRSIGWSLRTWS